MRGICTLAIFVSAFVVGSCNKLAGPANAGLGGTSVIEVTPTNAQTGYVDSCTVYIKYNSSTPPANNVYDDSAYCVLVNNVPTATFSSLNVGVYYIHTVGYQSGLTPPWVTGGEAYTILQPGTFNIYMPTAQGL